MFSATGYNFLFFILIVVLLDQSCTTNKIRSGDSEIDLIGQDFVVRLENYKSEVRKLVYTQLGKKSKSTDVLIFFTYAGFGNSKITCEALKSLTTDKALEVTTFSRNSPCCDRNLGKCKKDVTRIARTL